MLNIEEFADNSELFDGHYALIRPLSVDGATADVWLALDTNTVTEEIQLSDIIHLHDDEIEKLGLVVAIKIYRPQNALDIEGEQRFRDEYMIVFNCHHTNLIHPTHFSIFRETPYLVLPYCKLGSSELLIGNPLENEAIWKYIKDVASGLAYLHALTPPIIHQDIKPANILLDDTLHYAITDFGISAQKGGIHGFYYDEENSGTLAYMAPERFQEGAEPIPQSDIWAFGATLCEILTGKVPFGEEGGKNQIETNAEMPVIPNVSSDIQRLINACLSKEPGDRPSAEQIIKAAEAQQYPIKSKKFIYGALIALFVVLIVCATYFLSKSSEEIVTYQPTPEELYDLALNKMNSNDVDSLQAGLEIMDSLSNMKYIPAIYQMVLTYGWYKEKEPLRRKEILGIEMGSEGEPISDIYMNKAVALYTQIVQLNDSTYGKELADAGYRLAWYYLKQYNNNMQNLKKTRDYLRNSQKWAMKVNDTIILKRTNIGLQQIDRVLNDNN
jgi:serine/threonine protein kinase